MKFLLLIVFCLIVAESVADNVKCYQCEPVNQECTVAQASSITCGSPQAQCQSQWKKGASDKTKVIRKCVIPDPTTKKVTCPMDHECQECTSDLCNSATLAKLAWPTVAAILVAIFYV